VKFAYVNKRVYDSDEHQLSVNLHTLCSSEPREPLMNDDHFTFRLPQAPSALSNRDFFKVFSRFSLCRFHHTEKKKERKDIE
jgi:hypothetical protein